MASNTGPMTVFFVPTPITHLRPATSRRASAEWVDLAREQSPAPKPSISEDRFEPFVTQPGVLTHLARPRCEDQRRLGPKRYRAVTAVNLDVFVDEAKALLGKVPSSSVRHYNVRVLRGERPRVQDVCGLTARDLDHFCENFRNLKLIGSTENLHRPEILAVAHRLVGASDGASGPIATLVALAERQIVRVGPQVEAIEQKSTLRSPAEDDLVAFYRLLVMLVDVLGDEDVQRRLDPGLPVRARANLWGTRLMDGVGAGARGVGAGARWLNMRMGEIACEVSPLTAPTTDDDSSTMSSSSRSYSTAL